MFKPIRVEPLPNYRLWIEYTDGVTGKVNLSHLAGKGVFALWNDYAAFERVYIGDGGAIAWTEEIEICPDAVYMKITGKTLHQVEAVYARVESFLRYRHQNVL